jgi:hypothetical protein
MQKFAPFLDPSELPSLGSRPRASRLPLFQLNGQLDEVFKNTQLAATTKDLIRSLLLLWHDHLDASHVICQSVENSDGSLVHAIMHRREGDFWNSKYWFNRVGEHSAFPRLADDVKALSSDVVPGLQAKLIRAGQWNPPAFVDLCERYAGKDDSPEYRWLQQVQRLETMAALNSFLEGGAQ